MGFFVSDMPQVNVYWVEIYVVWVSMYLVSMSVLNTED